jgi:hypothetical protein
MQTRNVIRDGMTKRGRIDPVERLHDAMEFEYRPMLAAERELLADAVSRAKPDEGFYLIADAIADHLESWSEVDGKDKPVDPNFEAVSRLSETLAYKLYGIVGGFAPSARLPDATSDEENEHLESLRQRASGVHPADAEAEAAGN